MTEPDRPFFATAAKGTEGVLRDELRGLRIPAVRADRGGVHFGGGFLDAVRVCFETRLAQRVLRRVAQFEARDKNDLYDGVRGADWGEWLDAGRTLAVDAHVRDSESTHSGFVAQRTKDAIVDQLREKLGARTNVDREDPDVHVVVHLVRNFGQVYVDLAGEPLHRRGYRARAGEAPLKETLAAALPRLAGWDRVRPLLDPMCGSGTIAIEAALWAYDVAPGLLRKSFGFQRWRNFGDAEKRALSELAAAARARVRKEGPRILASDNDPAMVRLAGELARAAGVAIEVAERDVRAIAAVEPPGHIVTNPPYGVRLERGQSFDADLAQSFRRLAGHRVTVLCQGRELAQAMKAKPVQEHTLFNGPIECRLFTWDIES